jgi:hypothetical protein
LPPIHRIVANKGLTFFPGVKPHTIFFVRSSYLYSYFKVRF